VYDDHARWPKRDARRMMVPTYIDGTPPTCRGHVHATCDVHAESKLRCLPATEEEHVSYLLRVALPDRPGALGAVATAIGTIGGDIESIVVVERTADAAVDDFLVHLPAGALADTLYTAVTSTGARVESLRRWAGAIDLHRDMDLVDELAVADRASVFMVLTEFVPDVLRSAWALLVGKGDDRSGVLASSTAAPEFADLDVSWLPVRRARRLAPAEPWLPEQLRRDDLQLAVAAVGTEPLALVVGRPGGPVFLDSELARLAHLCSLAAAIRGA
jgi:hypothetical protein